MNEPEPTSRQPPRSPLQGRLNSFQRTMLDWNDVHPYNAVHVVKIPRPPDATGLKNTIQNTLEFQGLTNLALDRKHGTFRFNGGLANCHLEVMEGADAHELLRAEIERQVNTRFDIAGTFSPFRFFIIAEKDSFFLGLVYFHAVADATAIVHLLRQIYNTYAGADGLVAAKPFGLAKSRMPFQPFTLARKLAGFLAQLLEHRKSVRVAHRDVFDGRNRFEHFSLPPETLRALSTSAKSWGVTINDIFLALLLQCCSPFTLNRFAERPRGRISIGCIVNTRSDLNLEDSQAWGLMLGSFVVTHEVPEGIQLRELARDIRRQTMVVKQRKDYVGASPELVIGRFLLSFFSTEYRTKLYQKHYPLWGGVTNMNLNLLWPQPTGGPPVDCFRGVSTGPVTPLVLSVTTIRDVVNIGLTFRATTFTDPHIQQVKKHFLKIIGQLEARA